MVSVITEWGGFLDDRSRARGKIRSGHRVGRSFPTRGVLVSERHEARGIRSGAE